MKRIVKVRDRINIAIINIKTSINLNLTRYEANYESWMIWKAFVEYMKETYDSIEFRYIRFIHFHLTTQKDKDFVNAYYGRFRHMLSRQKRTIKHADDNHFYHYIFITGLKSEINSEVLRLPESLKMKNMKFNEILELAKRVKQIINS